VSDIRTLLQPASGGALPTLTAITTSLTASVIESPTCRHYLEVTIGSGPAGQVIVEIADGNNWTEILPTGMSQLAKSLAMGPPSRTTGKFTMLSYSMRFRARPRPGYTGTTVYVVLPITSVAPGASLAGVGSFSVTRTGAGSGTATCSVKLVPSGTAHFVYNTDFTKFTCAAVLSLYSTKPAITLGAGTPVAIWTSPVFTPTLDVSLYKLDDIPVPDLGSGDWYATMGASWVSSDCPACANGVQTFARVGNYPLVLKVT